MGEETIVDYRTTTKALWKEFHVHQHDNLPFECWWNVTRENLYDFFGKMGFKVGAEIGVRMGTNAKEMFNRIPGLKLYCVDPWEAYQRVTDSAQITYYDRCVRKLIGCDAVLMKNFSVPASKEFADESLDFVYVDGDHRADYVFEDILHWTPKVKKGGIISGHDYFAFYQSGVILAVDSYCFANNIKQFYTTREKAPSWFFCKE